MLTNATITSYRLRTGADTYGQPTFAAAVTGSWLCLSQPKTRRLVIAGREVVSSLALQLRLDRAGAVIPPVRQGDVLTIGGVEHTVLSIEDTPGTPGTLGHATVMLG